MEPKKHHYLPVFLLKQWAEADRRLCEFSRPHGDPVRPRRVFPTQTGYQEKLYSLRKWPDDKAHIIESQFFKPVDNQAAIALQLMIKGIPEIEWPRGAREAWCLFLCSLHFRMPEDLEILRNRWATSIEGIRQGLPLERRIEFDLQDKTVRELKFEREISSIFLDLSQSRRICDIFNSMKWVVWNTGGQSEYFYFSDRPIFRAAPLISQEAILVMPIGPCHIFMASYEAVNIQALIRRGSRDFIRDANKKVVSQAHRYAYAKDDRPMRFMSNNMSTFSEVRPISGADRQ